MATITPTWQIIPLSRFIDKWVHLDAIFIVTAVTSTWFSRVPVCVRNTDATCGDKLFVFIPIHTNPCPCITTNFNMLVNLIIDFRSIWHGQIATTITTILSSLIPTAIVITKIVTMTKNLQPVSGTNSIYKLKNSIKIRLVNIHLMQERSKFYPRANGAERRSVRMPGAGVRIPPGYLRSRKGPY